MTDPFLLDSCQQKDPPPAIMRTPPPRPPPLPRRSPATPHYRHGRIVLVMEPAEICLPQQVRQARVRLGRAVVPQPQVPERLLGARRGRPGSAAGGGPPC